MVEGFGSNMGRDSDSSVTEIIGGRMSGMHLSSGGMEAEEFSSHFSVFSVK